MRNIELLIKKAEISQYMKKYPIKISLFNKAELRKNRLFKCVEFIRFYTLFFVSIYCTTFSIINLKQT